jgi:glycogen debranching enzyme
VSADLSKFATVEGTRIIFHLMPPGFVCLVRTKQKEDASKAALELEQLEFPSDLFEETNIADFNHLLYKCEQEELDISGGKRGTYAITGHQFEYAGIASVVAILQEQ